MTFAVVIIMEDVINEWYLLAGVMTVRIEVLRLMWIMMRMMGRCLLWMMMWMVRVIR